MRRRITPVRYGIAIMLSATAVSVLGCSPPDDGIPPAEKKNADRFAEIVKTSGGDYDKLNEADRQFVLNDLAHGNENSARMLLAAKGGRLRGGRPGSPGGTGAPPSGPKP